MGNVRDMALLKFVLLPRTQKRKNCDTYTHIFTRFLYGKLYENWPLALREENKLRMF